MAHTPHLYAPRPWPDQEIALEAKQVHHLAKVLRHELGEFVSYTDGEGTRGAGVLGEASFSRGEESAVTQLPILELAVAPPHDRDRLRWLVEKAAELEVTRIRWLETRFGNARPQLLARAQEWAVSALEQSRGAWLTTVDSTLVPIAELGDGLTTVMADPTGEAPRQRPPLRVMVGPEGGWDATEIAGNSVLVSLGRSILRTETAAVVAAVLYRTQTEPGD